MPIRVPRIASGIAPDVRVEPQERIAQVTPVQDPAADPGVAGDAAALAEQIYAQDRANEVRTQVNEVDHRRIEADQKVIHDYLQQSGKNAVQQRANAIAAIRRNSVEIRKSVTDGVVQKQFEAMNRAHTNRAIQRLDAHYRQENRVYQRDTQQSRRDLYLQQFVQERVAVHADEIDAQDAADESGRLQSAYRAAVRELAQLEGWSGDTLKQELRAADGKADGLVVQELVRQGRLDEAEEVLGKGNLDPGLETQLRQQVRAASLKERGFQLADSLATEGGTVAQQLDRAKVGYDSGETDFEVYRSAVTELVGRLNRERAVRAAEGSDVLVDIQQWSKLNRGEEPSEEQWARLEAAGVDNDYRLWRLQGGQFITTTDGRELLDTITDRELLQHREFDTLRRRHRMVLSEQHMSALQSEWERAWGRAARGSAGGGGGGSGKGKTLTVARTVNGFLRSRSHLFDPDDPFAKLETETTNRINAFEDAVTRVLGTSEGSVDQAKIDQAVQHVWNDGGVVDGEWVPRAMATRAELEAMQSAFRPASLREPGFIGPLRNENGLVPVLPADFDIGGRFAEFRDRDTGRPNFESFLENDTDTGSLDDGLVVLTPGQEGDIDQLHRDPVTGDVVARAKGRLPGYEETAAGLAARGVEPTHVAVMQARALALVQLQRASGGARARGSAEVRVRRDRFLADLRDEFDELVAKAHSVSAEAVAQPLAKIERLKQQLPNAKVEKLSDALTAVRDGNVTHYVDTSATLRSTESMERGAWARLRTRYASELEAYGMGAPRILGLVAPAISVDPLWRALHGMPPEFVEPGLPEGEVGDIIQRSAAQPVDITSFDSPTRTEAGR